MYPKKGMPLNLSLFAGGQKIEPWASIQFRHRFRKEFDLSGALLASLCDQEISMVLLLMSMV